MARDQKSERSIAQARIGKRQGKARASRATVALPLERKE